MSATPSEPLPAVVPALTMLPECVPDYDDLVTEDHKPVERILVEKLYRLLTGTLYATWAGPGEGRPFLALANVGWFYKEKTPAVVPDVLLSLDVTCPEDLHVKPGHSYYQWQMGKPPDVLIEVVSDKLGGEETFKKSLYAQQGVPHYSVFDPNHYLSKETLRIYELSGGEYRVGGPGPWPGVGLGLRLWEGKFEGHHDLWLRWCDQAGEILPTGEERARHAEERIRELEAELRRLKGERG
jgi:Uma2 family endonuclease